MNLKGGFFTQIQQKNGSLKQTTLKWGEGGTIFPKNVDFLGVQHFCKRLYIQSWTKLLRKITVSTECRRLLTALGTHAPLSAPLPFNVALFLEHSGKLWLVVTNIERGEGGADFSQHILSKIVAKL